jgi:hypothetical protein
MSRSVLGIIVVLALTPIAGSQEKAGSRHPEKSPAATGPTESAGRLPVKRVVLYKNGVGYFEHSARVHGSEDLTIDFTTAQLNDVLKSLTAVDLGEGRISSVRYNSTAPLEERLKVLRLPFGEQVTQADFLSALRGTRVEVRTGTATATGRLLSVERERRSNGKGDFYDVTEFSIVTDGGDMRSFDLGPGTTVRIAERELNDDVGRYLNLVGSSRARDLRRMTISATGTGDREIFVSYISEVPIWKSTYRIILSDKPGEKPLLQGWAIVDNTIGEDWKDVKLSLVAGAPQSFIQDISQPYYVRRPVVALPPSIMLTPQAHEGTLESGNAGGIGAGSAGGVGGGVFRTGTGGLQGMVTDPSGAGVGGAQVTVRNEETGASQTTTTDARGMYQFYNVPAGNSALFVVARGFKRFDLTNFYLGIGRMNEIHARLEVGSATETVTVTAEPATVQTSESSLAEVASKQHVEAEGKDLGDYFEYNIKQKITIGKNQSALVPILQTRVDAEKVSIWNEDSKEIRRALWLKNTGDLTLDAGTFNIVEGDNFSGEGLIETLHPDERRLISYAADPALRITMDVDSSEKPVNRVRIAKGIMITTREERASRSYVLHNSDSMPRQVVIEHPARPGWRLAEGAKPEETSTSFLRFRVVVGPGQTEKLQFEEVHPDDTRYELTDLEDEQVKTITALVAENHVTPALLQALHRVLDQKNQISSFESQIKERQKEAATITEDQARVRENMKALKGSAEEKALLQRYVKQLDSQEDRLNTLHREIDDLQSKQTQAEEQLDHMVQEITLDESF